jgi:thymidylate kinase
MSMFVSELQAQLNIIKERIRALKNNTPLDAIGDYHFTDEQRKRYQRLIEKKRELENKILEADPR